MKQIPFYANTADNTHCFQAAIKSVLKYFLPNKNFSFRKLEKMSAKKEGLWTSAKGMLISLHKMGFDLVSMSKFNMQEYLKYGGDYLIKEYGDEVGNVQIKHTDIEHEKNLIRKYLPLNIRQDKLPSMKDIKKLIDEKYLIICLINSYALDSKKGYDGHFVLIFDYDSKNFILHDPGLPAKPNRKVSFKEFSKAWEYPGKKAKNLTAYKL